MRVILIQEGVCASGESWPQRVTQCVAEARLADEMGFDVYAMSEQHFARGEAIVSSPEIVLAGVATATRNIRLRTASINFLPYNHPLRVAEQIATLDLLSGGRVELGAARSNNPYTLAGFGVDAAQTRSFRKEHMAIIGQALATGEVEYRSEHYDIPRRTISPWPKGRTPPPVHLSASGIDSHREAAKAGVGVMTGLSIVGWDYAAACLTAYKDTIGQAEATMGRVTNRAALLSVGVCCHKDRQVARDQTRHNTLAFVEVILDFFLKLADQSPDYAYFGRLNEIVERKADLDYLIDATPYVNAGTPDDLVANARKLHAMGFDDLIWRIDGLGHENNKASIEMIGRHVLPELHRWPEHANASREDRRL